ncbi:unnamed protein product [Spirodela intermedia]|uniref:Bifunctional inhibitor/plant lipid transfer protein/seed storage helical domain-containing protein n=2 Tax=Spirodela intermedia TaxID=51605 RepID=A0A7I8K666_SPIIN|nr:unnamed protein product [Spirodela intermedia]CAA6656586.1 unnamed protein product [Spirodela intermedia]CAA7392179.1 unnamed protein product [Spirodela intermedia]
MASNSHVKAALLLIFHLLFFTLVSGQTPSPEPVPAPPPPAFPILRCVINIISLAICAPVLTILKFLGLGNPNGLCCTIIKTLSANQAASCLCIAIKANILGINISIPGDIKLLLNLCGLTLPIGFACP